MTKKCKICDDILIPGKNWRESVYVRKHLRCTKCISENRRKYYLENKASILARNLNFRKVNPVKPLFSRAKARAKDLNLEFTIEETDIHIPEICPVFKVPFTFSNKQNQFSPSLDRIDSSKGYIKGNVQVISHLANTMKSNATKEQLLQFSEWVQQCL